MSFKQSLHGPLTLGFSQIGQNHL